MDLFHSPAFSARVEELLDQHHVPGVAIAIVQDKTIASAGFGMASLDPPRKFTPDTLLDIASASKSLTAASIGLLVKDDKYPGIKYEAIMSTLLRADFVMPGEGYTESVTIEDILSHRSGMPSHDTSYMGPNATQPDDARSVTRNLRNLPVAAPIRSKYMYCNMMYTVATHLVEHTTRLSFSDFLDEKFFKPLNMNATNLQPSRAQAKGLGDRISNAHCWDEGAQEYKVFQSPDGVEGQGAGSIVTSVNDYVKYVRALMNQEDPFTKDVYDGLIKSRTLQDPDYKHPSPYTSPVLYAAGWEVTYYRGHMVVAHDGAIPGIGTRHFFLPEYKFGGVIFGNSEDAATVTAVLGQELIDEVLSVPKDERPDWNKIETERYPKENIEEAKETIRQELCPGIKDAEPQKMPLSAYSGDYWNPGYRGMHVQVKEGKLFIDATDRSFRFTLTFDHVCDQTKYIAHLIDVSVGNDEALRAEFRFENDVAVRMGIHLELDLEEYIWFDRVKEETSDDAK